MIPSISAEHMTTDPTWRASGKLAPVFPLTSWLQIAQQIIK